MRALVAEGAMDLKIGQVTLLEGGDGELSAASIKASDGAMTRVEMRHHAAVLRPHHEAWPGGELGHRA
jgi:hypothetical protein